jgi:chemotaxis protein MotB
MSRKRPEKKQISQEWLTTYSDMMTLVLCFFVLLYSYSLIDMKKFNAMATSVSSAFGGTPSIMKYNSNAGDVPIVGSDKPKEGDTNGVKTDQAEKNVYNTVTDFVEKNSLQELVTIKEGSRGVYIEFKEKILFDTGKAEIKSEGIPTLMKISELIRNMSNQVVIEGHTDNVPIQTSQFKSNWDLSSARATSVLNYMIDNRGIDAKRLSIAAYGEYNPIASNDTPDGRMQNRRVNVLIITANESPAVKR